MAGPSTSTYGITAGSQELLSGHRRAPTKSATYKASHSLAIDDVDDRAELAEISSVADVSDTSNFNKTSENLGSG